jgi:hypothetical protein
MIFFVAFAFLLASVQAFQTLSHDNVHVHENVAKEQAFRSRIVEEYRNQNASVKEPTTTFNSILDISSANTEQKRRQWLVEEYQRNLFMDQSASTIQVSNNAEPPKPAFVPKVPEAITPTDPASQNEQRIFVYSPQVALGLRHKVLLLAQVASRTAKQLASTTTTRFNAKKTAVHDKRGSQQRGDKYRGISRFPWILRRT